MTHVEQVAPANMPVVAHKLDVFGWGLFFLWVGVALLADRGKGADKVMRAPRFLEFSLASEPASAEKAP